MQNLLQSLCEDFACRRRKAMVNVREIEKREEKKTESRGGDGTGGSI